MKKDFHTIRERIQVELKLFEEVLDNFLIFYAAVRDRVDKEFDLRLAKYKHVANEMSDFWISSVKTQYIAHKIFKSDGLIKKYLNHAAIRQIEPAHLSFIKNISATPWRFSFSVIIDKPAEDFYQMRDVFTYEEYLLYSPSAIKLLSDGSVELWFNLISYNGDCWETFGPLLAFRSIAADDIFFFATELSPRINSDDDLLKHLEENPVPYMLLTQISETPSMISMGQQVRHLQVEMQMVSIDLDKLKKNFNIDTSFKITRIKDNTLSAAPHHAILYVDPKTKEVQLNCLTDSGYMEMVNKLRKSGLDLPDDPDIRVHPVMLAFIQTLLKKKASIGPYTTITEEEEALSVDSDDFQKLNDFLSLALPIIQKGKKPDINQLASQVGLDLQTALEVTEAIKKSSDKSERGK